MTGFAPRAFFSMATLPNPADHYAYNEWHQLDHRPENLLLPGVAWGDRWVRSPDVRSLVATPEELGSTHYANMYWFRPPWEQSVAEWTELAQTSIHWGRRFDLGVADRTFIGFFRPVKGYAADRVLLSPDALPYRPVRGIRATLTYLPGARPVEQQAVASWVDRTRIPALTASPGVAGAWTLVSDPSIPPPLGATISDGVTLRLLFLDEDPAVVEASLPAADDHPYADLEAVLFDGYFRAIEPWRWDWFEGEP